MKDRKKYLRMVMGGLTDTQLTISPVFYYTYVDLWGPLKAYCPGYGKLTRREKGYEVHFLVFSCVSTGAINVQLVEGKSTEFILEGCSRFFNETSVPAIMYPDGDGALVKAFKEGEIDIQDLSGRLYKQKGIQFEICPPQGHYCHGRIERVIRSLQESFTRSGASSSRCTATGWSTIGKALERDINNIPIGFLYEKSAVDGNPLLRVLKPSSLKGLNCSDRAPSGLFTIPENPGDHFSKVQQAYNLWSQCWLTSYLPLIMHRQKWDKEDDNLELNDVVYFMLDEKVLKPDWRIGKVEAVQKGRDNRVRQVTIAYKVFKENDSTWTHSAVTRPVRKVIKLFELKDTTFAEEMAACQRAAEDILAKAGSLDPNSVASGVSVPKDPSNQPSVDSVYSSKDSIQASITHSQSSFSKKVDLPALQSFVTCVSYEDWYQNQSKQNAKEQVTPKDFNPSELHEISDEILFLV